MESHVMEARVKTAVQAGDVLEVVGHHVADDPRYGEILEVLGDTRHPHFRVRWEDGHVSLLFPSSDVRIIHAS